MLVLTRFLDERILIGSDIVVQVVAIRGDRVRLGVVAPVETPVHREEVVDRIVAAGGSIPAARPPAELVRAAQELRAIHARGPKHGFSDLEWASLARRVAALEETTDGGKGTGPRRP